jgi:hypothetical protein
MSPVYKPLRKPWERVAGEVSPCHDVLVHADIRVGHFAVVAPLSRSSMVRVHITSKGKWGQIQARGELVPAIRLDPAALGPGRCIVSVFVLDRDDLEDDDFVSRLKRFFAESKGWPVQDLIMLEVLECQGVSWTFRENGPTEMSLGDALSNDDVERVKGYEESTNEIPVHSIKLFGRQ